MAENELQSTYNDYLMLINRIYAKRNVCIKEDVGEKEKDSAQTQKVYKFTSYYNTEYTFTNYYKYLYEKGKNEWDWATCMLGTGGQNMANDPKSLSTIFYFTTKISKSLQLSLNVNFLASALEI